jgi:hypothetical protein
VTVQRSGGTLPFGSRLSRASSLGRNLTTLATIDPLVVGRARGTGRTLFNPGCRAGAGSGPAARGPLGRAAHPHATISARQNQPWRYGMAARLYPGSARREQPLFETQ